jgi:hypothetical protein
MRMRNAKQAIDYLTYDFPKLGFKIETKAHNLNFKPYVFGAIYSDRTGATCLDIFTGDTVHEVSQKMADKAMQITLEEINNG